MINIEWIENYDKIGIIRMGEKLENFLDPYEFSCIIHIKDNIAYLKGGCGKFKQNWKKLVYKELIKYNIEFIYWDRVRKDGSVHIVGPYKIRK